jgi:L-threonylcarbamoyladenylate synthase
MLTLAEADKVAGSLRNGSLAVLPTETGHMLAALATNMKAVESAFTVKGRATANVMHVACASLQMAEQVGVINQLAMRLLGDLTPGPVTVVVKKTPLLPVINAVGAPVTATSLNSSGSAPEPLAKLDLQALNWPESGTVYIVKDDDAIAYSAPSTLVRITGGSLEILRKGPVPGTEIHRVASIAR